MSQQDNRRLHTILFIPQSDHELVDSLVIRREPSEKPERRLSMSRTSAYWYPPKPVVCGASENPKPGRLGATTWKLGQSGDGEVRRGRSLRTSRKLLGPVVNH